uniref:Ig-like domain-containing protein n=1 Tax=Arion vulgaris TaxID=1028688 RepID=A0A0B6YXP7_9EUPU
MDVGNVQVNYTFTDTVDKVTKTYYSQVYTPGPTGRHLVTCSASYNNHTIQTSESKDITFSDNHLPPPALTPIATDLLQGSRLILTCGEPLLLAVYVWTKDSKEIPLLHDRILQLDNFNKGDAGSYSCSLKKNNYITLSKTINIRIAENISQPEIQTDNAFFENETYDLKCHTPSVTPGMTYTWSKNDILLANETSIHYILKDVVATKNNGNYTCTASFRDKTAESRVLIFKAGAAPLGKPCDPKSKPACPNKTPYTGECDVSKKPYRCKCLDGHKLEGSTCQKGNMMAYSVILLVAGIIFSRLISVEHA